MKYKKYFKYLIALLLVFITFFMTGCRSLADTVDEFFQSHNDELTDEERALVNSYVDEIFAQYGKALEKYTAEPASTGDERSEYNITGPFPSLTLTECLHKAYTLNLKDGTKLVVVASAYADGDTAYLYECYVITVKRYYDESFLNDSYVNSEWMKTVADMVYKTQSDSTSELLDGYCEILREYGEAVLDEDKTFYRTNRYDKIENKYCVYIECRTDDDGKAYFDLTAQLMKID